MIDFALVRSLGVIIVAGALFALLARTARMPSIVAYLVAGVVVGPVAGLVQPSTTTELISHIGIALLLFLVGLELSLDKIRDVGRVALVAGVGQVFFTALGGYVLVRLLGFTAMEALFLAIALTFSSTVIVVKLLDEKGDLDTLYGRISIGIFLVQDLVAIVILTFLSGLGSDVTAASAAGLAIGLLKAFSAMAVLLAIVLLAARFVLPGPLSWAALSPDMLFVASLAWCFLLATGAQLLGLSLEIGAFLAGLALAQLPYHQELHRRIHPLMNFFIAVFFVSLGTRLEIDPQSVNWLAAAVLSLFVLVGNPLIFMLIISRMGYGPRVSFMSGVAVAQISEFSFVLVALGLASGLIGNGVLSLTALIGLLTFALSSYMILYNERLYEALRHTVVIRWLTAGSDEPMPLEPVLGDHIIIVGMNTLGRELAIRLHEAGESVLAIDTDNTRLAGVPGQTMIGSVEYLSTLQDAGISRARLVVSALQSEEANDLLAYRCGVFGVPCSIHAIDLSVIENLLRANATYLMIPKVDGIRLQTRELKKMGFIRK